ncbi:MAG: SPOR domain-containing protein, partial [Treponema sp.]|nr:SPOR domain-containing protein [Treponema sp.]
PPRKPAPAAADSGVQDLTIKVIVTVNGQEHTVEIPVTQPAAAPAASPAAAPVPVLPPASGPSVKIVPRMPDPQNGRIYRVQVGAFSSQVFAQECYDKVKTTGLSPAFERYGNLHRVVISGVKAAEMPQIAQRLGAAGFKEAWAREEN